MRSGDRMTVSEKAPENDTRTGMAPVFGRVLVAVEDASQVKHVVELARRAGTSEARVLHLNLRESIGGRRYALESDSAASYVVEATVFELRMLGIGASGQVRHALVDRAAEAIVAEAAEWGADLIVLGVPSRSEFASRVFGSVTLRVILRAQCPVLVASSTDGDQLSRVAEERYAAASS
jgi:nucleotide-binding universal stress UspA family protein